MPSYILRKIDDDLWQRAKARAAAQDQPLKAVILALLALYADGKVNVSTVATKAAKPK